MATVRLLPVPLRPLGASLLAIAAVSAAAAQPPVQLREVSAAWGLVFQHHHGGAGRFYHPETVGSGVVLFDYDGDGDLDVFFVDGGELPGYTGEPGRSRLYRNEGDRRFTDVTDASGVVVRAYGMGGAAGDVDGDGDLDLYVTAFGSNQLLRNDGDGRFSDVTAAAGVGDPRWSSSAGFADSDGDGDLDLYVVNYLDYSLADHVVCRDPQSGIPGYCHPANLRPQHDRFYRNRGDGTFVDATAEAGFGAADGKGLGLVFTDLDGDGWPDLYVANDTTPNFLFRNRGDGTFEDVSLLSGTAYGDRMVPEAGMGIAVGDIDADGYLDLLVTNFALETNALYRNLGGHLFNDARWLFGIAEPSLRMLGFGAAFADFDQDGRLDLVIANGHIFPSIELTTPGLTFKQRNQLFLGIGGGRFAECTECGLETVRVSRGLAVGDLDGDGDVDLVITNSNDLAEVYENLSEPAGRRLLISLAGAAPNRQGIGARVEAESGGRRQAAQVLTTTSYLSQSALALHFGLGSGRTIERLTVRWPGGRRQRLGPLPADVELRLWELARSRPR